jgi:anaerobic selenocysteine-containing dehydrogenase
MDEDISRRSFLKLAGIAGSMLAADGCNPEKGTKLIPYLVPDQNVLPGVPGFYRTLCGECGAGCGVVARVREGRTIKLEGNPENPINAGALCARGQASLQGLYNPDRLPKPQRQGQNGQFAEVSWDQAVNLIAAHLKEAAVAPNRVAFLGAQRGPSFHEVLNKFLEGFDSNLLCYYEPLNESAARQAAKSCFGRSDLPFYRIDNASVLISFGADFLETWRSPVELARQYSDFRNPQRHLVKDDLIGVSYYIGPRMSLTAAKSDYYFQCRPGTETTIALAMLRSMSDRGQLKNPVQQDRINTFLKDFAPENVARRTGLAAKEIHNIAEAFSHASAAIALAGTDDPECHAAVSIMNYMTGNFGKTVSFWDSHVPNQPEAGQLEISSLIREMKSGKVTVLLIAGSNPVFTTSSELKFRAALDRVPFVVWCGTVPDETAETAHLQLPINHTLEDWSDQNARPGVYALGQPTMEPVFGSASIGDLLLRVALSANKELPWPDFRSAVRSRWNTLGQALAFANLDELWTSALKAGGLFVEAQRATVRLKLAVLSSPPPNRSIDSASHFTRFSAHLFLRRPGFRQALVTRKPGAGVTAGLELLARHSS